MCVYVFVSNVYYVCECMHMCVCACVVCVHDIVYVCMYAKYTESPAIIAPLHVASSHG